MKRILGALVAAASLTFAPGCLGVASDFPGEEQQEHVHDHEGHDHGPALHDEDSGTHDHDAGHSDDAGGHGHDAGAPDASHGHGGGGGAFDAGKNPDGSVELDPIPTNFDAGPWLVPAGGNGAIPVSAAPDNVGAFRFICNPSHESYDDPIVYPGQVGKAHLHQFFGNTLANAHSTYESLRTTGESTCNNALNRSSYWMPAMMNGKGKVVRPDYVVVYYKRFPKTSPDCQRMGKECVNLPRGLRYVFGWNGAVTQQEGLGWFNCDGKADAGVVSGHFPDIPTAAKNCPMGSKLGAVIPAASCWNGKDLDSPDHRSHMAYPKDTHLGYEACPATHPYVIPQFTLGAWYSVDADLDHSGTWVPGVTNTWHLSSDQTPTGMLKPGTTLHSDWFGAWDDDVLKAWSDNCIDKLLNCSAGDLGNGQQLGMYPGFSWTANPHVVDPPIDPTP